MNISSTWLTRSKFVRLLLVVVWVFAICFFSTKLLWASGYGCINEFDSLWCRVVDCKYGSQRRGWCSNQTKAPYGVSLWKYIRAGWESFAKHITFKMGDGSRIKFWKDSWCGDQPLQTRFPELFRLACDPNATVDTHLRFHNATHVWDIEFYRPFQDWELEMGVSFMELLYSLPIRRGTMDSMWWQPSNKGIFEIRSYYSVLVQSSDTYFP